MNEVQSSKTGDWANTPRRFEPLVAGIEDFVLAETVDEHEEQSGLLDEQMQLAEVDCPSRDQWQAKVGLTTGTGCSAMGNEETRQEETAEPRSRFRFSLLELMAVMTFAAISLAAASWLPVGAFAGLMGMVTLSGLLVLTWFPPRLRVASLAWITVLTIYLAAAAVAVGKTVLGT